MFFLQSVEYLEVLISAPSLKIHILSAEYVDKDFNFGPR